MWVGVADGNIALWGPEGVLLLACGVQQAGHFVRLLLVHRLALSECWRQQAGHLTLRVCELNSDFGGQGTVSLHASLVSDASRADKPG